VTELRISEAAAVAILEQADYYLHAANVALAQRWEEAVDQAVLSLLNFPEHGTHCRFRFPSLSDLRWIFVPGFPRHMVFYRFSPDESIIRVVQVLHGTRNLETILDESV
jgi:plasmid stabilization system protein ParE